MRLQERSIGYILRHTRRIWSDINNYSTKTNSGRRLTLTGMVPVERKDLLTLLLHYSQIHQLWRLLQQPQEYQMFQGLVRLVSQLCLHSGNWQLGSRISPITRESGADRLVPSETLDTQLRKSWT